MTAPQRRYLKRRDVVMDAVKSRHERDSVSPVYRELVRVRKRIANCRRSIEVFKVRIGRRRSEIHFLTNKKERLELAWGQERAKRKREGIR